MGTRYFTPKLFAFLRDLAANNDRDWFEQHRDDYESHVREPALDFIADMAEPLGRISPHFVADTRKVGGSLFRIQRDTRFTADKTPYKTNTGVHFRHRMASDVHAPGFYLHLEPGGCFMGAGIWHPDAATAHAIRTAIAEESARWQKITRSPAFAATFSLAGEELKRPPRGFDPEHPLIDDLRKKDFSVYVRLTQAQITSSDFGGLFVAHCRRSAPFVEFLCEATEVPF